MEDLVSSTNELVENGTSVSSILLLQNHVMDIFVAQNASIEIQMPRSGYATKKQPQPSFTLEVDGNFDNSKFDKRLAAVRKPKAKPTILEEMTMKMKQGNLGNFSQYIDYPVMLVDNNLDSW